MWLTSVAPPASGVPARLSYVLLFCKSYVFCISLLATIISAKMRAAAGATCLCLFRKEAKIAKARSGSNQQKVDIGHIEF